MMTQKLGNGFEFMKKACSVSGSFNHLIKDYDFHDNKLVEKSVLNNKGRVASQREIRPVWNNAQRVNHQNKLTHPHPKRNFIPTAVATKSGQVPVNAAKQSSPRAAASISTAMPVNTAAPKPKVNDALPITYSYFKAYSPGNPQYTLQDQGIFDSGCSRHMTGNKSFFIDYQEIDGGFVAFGGSPKGAVNTTCYVQNRVLVTKPHNKTPYELLHGIPPSIRFMRTFGCPTTILNTLDPLGKFDGKTDEGYLVGYSINSKAFKLLHGIKLIGMHVSKIMLMQYLVNNIFCYNYFLIVHSSEDAVADDAGKKITEEPANKGKRNGQDKEGGASNKQGHQHVQDLRAELDKLLAQQKECYANNANKDSTVSPSVSVVGKSFVNNDDLPTNPLMPDLEDTTDLPTSIFSGAYDNEDVGAEADLNNLETTMNVNLIPTTRTHKDHPKDQIIGDINLATQTRKMTKISEKHALIAEGLDIGRFTNGKRAIGTKWVFRNKKDERGIVVRNKARLVVQGYTQEEGIDYDEVFAPVARIEAIRLFFAYASFMGFIVYQMDVKSAFLYGTIEEEVYVCQPPGFEDPQFPDKVYKVEKALYGLHQAPRAWYETLSTYLLENRFRRGTIDKTLFIKKDRGDILLVQVYVDDIIFGSTKKSLCVEFEQMMHKRFQMSSMGELTFFLGLQVKQKDDGIFISQDKYVADILKKFDFVTVKTASTPIETNKALLKDEEAEDVDVHLYRSMIGSLMYLTASRPDIMFAVCACARFQVTPKVSHLHAVKRIFRYLKGQPKLGLWYPRDSPFDLEAFSDSDYARASLDRKSTLELSISGKKVLWIQNQMLDYGFNFMNTKIYIDNESTICIVKNLVFHSKTKHIEIRHLMLADGIIDEFGVKTGSCKVNAARQDLVLLGKNEAVFMEWNDRVVRATTTAASLDAEQDNGGIIAQTRSERVPTPSYDSPLLGGNTPRSDEERIEQHELTDFVPPTPHDSPLSGGHTPGKKDAQAVEILNLKKRVKKLERKAKSSIPPPKRRLYNQVDSSDDNLNEENLDDINNMADDAMENAEGDTETQGRNSVGDAVTTAGVSISAAEPRTPPTTTTTVFEDEDLTITQTLVKMRSEKAKEKGVAFRDVEESARPIRIRNLPTIDPKDKGKGIMQEPEKPPKNLIKAQIQRDAEIA
ncbi:putative ribonuclease H-like domain-containing protein [Tanacetum coccineum]